MVTALLTIAEHEGLAAINMRRVASDLGVSPRLIYHHVRDKEEMLVTLFDEILARNMPALEGLGWEDILRAVTATARRAYSRYPGVAAAILARAVNAQVQPHAAIIRDAVMGALESSGLGPHQVDAVYVQFSVITLGNLVLLENLDRSDKELAITREHIEESIETGLGLLISVIRRLATAGTE
jgi:AcrR family transcriptional regulator